MDMEDERDLEVIVVGFAGEICRFSASAACTVRQAKNLIESATGICPLQQRLIADVAVLRDHDKLRQVLVDEPAYLTLVKRSPEEAEWLDLADKDWSQLLDLPAELWGNSEVVELAVSRCGWALRYASPELRGNTEVVLAAVGQNGLSLQYASDALRGERRLALAAAMQCGRALDFVAPELLDDRSFVLEVVSLNGRALEHCGVFRGDRDVVLAAVAQCGYALAGASPDLRADHEVVAAAVKQDPGALVFASHDLRPYFHEAAAQMNASGGSTSFDSDDQVDDDSEDDGGEQPELRRRYSSGAGPMTFGRQSSDGHRGMSNVLGRTGALLCEMTNLGLPVVPGFCVSANDVPEGGLHDDASASSLVKQAVFRLEETTGQFFGSLVQPLLLTVRTDDESFGEPLANIGLTDRIVEAWAMHENPRFIWDSYRRLIFNFSRLVKKLDMAPFEGALAAKKQVLDEKCTLGRRHQTCDLPTSFLKELVAEYKNLYHEQAGEEFPQDPGAQLAQTLRLVLTPSEESEVPAAVVQAMAFGNYGTDSAAGVARFTSSGRRTELRGEWMVNAQHDDLGRSERPALKLTKIESQEWAKLAGIPEEERASEFPSLEERMPGAYSKLVQHQDTLAAHVAEAKSVDFLVQQGRLWILQPRLRDSKGAGRRSSREPGTNDVSVLHLKLQAEAAADPLCYVEEPATYRLEGLGAIAAGYAWSCVGGAWVPASVLAALPAAAETTSADAGRPRAAEAGLGWSRTQSGRARRSGRHSRSAPPAGGRPVVETPSAWGLSTKLPIWQTALAGGLAGLATQLAAGNGVCPKALPMGALCCTGYVNCLNAVSEDGDLDSVPVHKRLVCAGAAATFATTAMHLGTSAIAATPMRLALVTLGGAVGRIVPALAIEMTSIDVVKSAIVKDGGAVTPGVLLASGAAAGIVSHCALQPISSGFSRLPDVRMMGKLRVLAPIVRGMVPCLHRSIPGTAANSLVRVGMVTYFLSSASTSDQASLATGEAAWDFPTFAMA